MNGIKKIACLFLSIILFLVFIPFGNLTVKAKEPNGKSCEIGDSIIFGQYEQDGDETNGKEDIEWKVLKVESDRVLVVSKYALDCKKYNETLEDVTWETCSLRHWLNNDFKNDVFSSDEQGVISTVSIENEDNPYFNTAGGNNTNDQIFCLSLEEMITYFNGDRDLFEERSFGWNQELLCEPTQYAINKGAEYLDITSDEYNLHLKDKGYTADVIGRRTCFWWLRSPGYNSKYACYVNSAGYGGKDMCDTVYLDWIPVRPAMYINLSAISEGKVVIDPIDNTQIRVFFKGGIYAEDDMPQMDIIWDLNKFAQDSHNPADNELAIASLVLAANSYGYDNTDTDLLSETFFKMGLSKPRFNNYDGYYGDVNRIGYGIASTVKKIDGIDSNLIVISCRGSSGSFLGPDWFSNITQQGQGFREAAEDAKSGLELYIRDLEIDTSIPTKILITGHSRGAAVANILGTMLSGITNNDNVFVYTFACPNTTTDVNRDLYSNIKNYMVEGDFVPSVPPMIGGNNKFGRFFYYDIDKVNHFGTNFTLLTGLDKCVLDEKAWFTVKGDYANLTAFRHHAPATYMACLLGDEGEEASQMQLKYRIAYVKCPVDLEIYSEDGEFLGAITNNVADDSLFDNGIFVDIKDDEKYIYSLLTTEYKLILTGTDDGTMDYGIQTIDTGTGSFIEEKEYSPVILFSGKKMISFIGGEIETPDVELFCIDDEEKIVATINEDGTEIPVDFTVSFDSGEGTGSMESEDVAYGTEYELPDSDFIAPIGKDFDKWDKGDVGEKITIQGDVTATALWKDHELTHYEQIDATCIDAGTEEYWECTNCGKLFSGDAGTVEITEPVTIPIDEDAHDWGEWTETLAPTETEKGEEKRICKNNSEHYETREVSELGHEHVLTKVTKNEATCEKDGNIEYWECSGCHRLFSDSSAENSIEKEDTILEAKGHTPGKAVKENEIAATKEKDGSYDEVVYCEDCGKELERNEKIIEKLSSEDDDKDEKDNKQDDDKKDNKENENNEDVTIPEVPKDWLDPLNEMLNIAASLGGEQIVEISGDYALPYDVMNFLQQHPQITLIYHVTYQGETYTVTIPGSKAIVDDNIPWYGPLLLNAYYNGELPIGVGGTYVVKAGDTLSALSDRLGVKIQALIDKNGIINPNLIYEGQIIMY